MRHRWESYLNRLFKDARVEALQTPLRRRSVALAVIIWQALVVVAIYQLQYDRVWPALVAAVPMVYLIGMLNMSTRGIFELADRHLDEFQISLRDGAFRRSYVFTLVWLLLSLLVVLALGQRDGGVHAVLAFGLLGFFWGMSLPRVMVAWTLPADEPDEDVL